MMKQDSDFPLWTGPVATYRFHILESTASNHSRAYGCRLVRYFLPWNGPSGIRISDSANSSMERRRGAREFVTIHSRSSRRLRRWLVSISERTGDPVAILVKEFLKQVERFFMPITLKGVTMFAVQLR